MYGYVGGNPISRVDPSGLAPGDFTDPSANLQYLEESANEAVDTYGALSWQAIGLRGTAVMYDYIGLTSAQIFGQTWGTPNSTGLDRVESAGWLGLNLLSPTIGLLKAFGTVKLGGVGSSRYLRSYRCGGFANKVTNPITKAGLPQSGRIRFVPPLGWTPAQKLAKGGSHGFLDRFKNEWVWDPIKGEWDVQLSKAGKEMLDWLSNSGQHVNVSPQGHVTH